MSRLRLLLPLVLLFPAFSASAEDAAPKPAEDEVRKPVNLWPLLYRQESKEGVEVEALFSLYAYKRYGRKIDLAVRPLFWKSSDPERSYSRADVLWPLAMHEVQGDTSTWRALPLYFQKRKPPDFYSLIFPLYHYKSDASTRDLGLIGFLPFTLFDFRRDDAEERTSQRYVIWTYDRTKDQTGLVVFPLFASESTRSTGRRHFSALGWADTFNLFEYGKDPSKDAVYGHALNFWASREGADRRTVFFPFYWDSAIHGDSAFFLWPFYGLRKKGTSVERSTLWPFFRFKSDEPAKETDWNVLWPLARDHRKGTLHALRIFPLFARDRDPDRSEDPPWLVPNMALPLPLWYRASGKDNRYERLLYLHWLSDNPDAERQVTLTYYSLVDKASKASHSGVFPFYHSSHWDDKTLRLALPLFASYQEPGFSATALPPLFWRFASTAAATTALFPVYFDRHSGDFSLRVLFPLYYHTRDEGLRTEFSYFFPLYGMSARDGRITRHLLCFPLYSRLHDPELGLNSLDVVWPLFHIERSTAASSARLLPLYWGSRGPENSFDIAFPVYWSFDNPRSKHRYVLPLYGRYDRKGELSVSAFGPFYWRVERPQEGYKRMDVLGSLYSRTQMGDESRSHLFPFYWHASSPDKDVSDLPPFGGFGRYADGYRDLFLLGIRPLNLFEFTRSPQEGSQTDRALLYYRRQDKVSSMTLFVPLYYQWRDPLETGRVLFPLFGRHEFLKDGAWRLAFMGVWGGFSLFEFGAEPKQDKSMARALLYYHQRAGQDRATIFVPLYWRFATADTEWRQSFPLFAFTSSRSKEEWNLGLLGVTPKWSLFCWSDSKTEKTRRFWPLYGLKKNTEKREGSTFLLGFHPKFSAFLLETGADTTEMRFLFRFLRWRRAPDESAFEFNPFYFDYRKGKDRYWAVLGGLFGVETKPDGTRRYTRFWFWQSPGATP